MNVKRVFIIVFTVVLMSMMLVACSKDEPIEVSNQASMKSENQVTLTPTKESEKTETDVTNQDSEPTDVVEQQSEEKTNADESVGKADGQKKIRDIPSTDLVKEIKIGWNLGNTMDATGGNGVNSETSWGNPVTTKKMIDEVKAAGFNTIRIPTTWAKHLGPAPDYKIDEAWLNRVQEIVDYAMENEMFVIINAHHENWYFPSYDNLAAAKKELSVVWSQIAERFKDYDEHVIFEGMNEPRMIGTNFEWNGGNDEGRDVVNQLNAAFVETIRKAGGNNLLRHLMIPPYAASSDTRTWNQFVVPKDNKIIVSIHAYTPYNFALNAAGTATWSAENANDTREIDGLMNNIYNNFVSKGIPVIIGEFGARDKNNNLVSRAAWAQYYIKKGAEKGIPCIWWDNGAFTGTGENFGLLDRKSLTWKFPEIVSGLMKGLR